MAVEYRDETSFTDDKHTPTEIAKAIRTKKYGKDVREAMAQSVEFSEENAIEFKAFSNNLNQYLNRKVSYMNFDLIRNSYISVVDNSDIVQKYDERANHSPKISVKPGETYFVYSKNFWDGRCVILIDEQNKSISVYPSSNDNNDYTLTVTIPENAVGMYVNCDAKTTPFVTKLESYEPKKDIPNRDINATYIFENVDYETVNGYFWSSYIYQGFAKDDRAMAMKTPLSVKAGEIYKVSGKNFYNGKLYLILDEFGRRIGELPQNDGIRYQDVIFTIPNGASFIVCSGYGEKTVLKKWTGKIDEYINRKWEAIGDSLTDPSTLKGAKNYVDYVKDNLKLTNVVNSGIGGTGYIANNNGSTTNFRTRQYSSDADLYTLYGSFNDAWAFSNFGTIDSTDTNTLYGAIKATIDHIISINNNAKIGIIVPAPWGQVNTMNTNSVGNFANAKEFGENYVHALKEVGMLYGVPVLDLYHNSTLRPWDNNFISEFYHGTSSTDRTHLNTDGHKRIASMISDFIKELL